MTSQPPAIPAPMRFFELADLATPHAIRVAATLGLVDLMPATVDELAKKVGVQAGPLAKLLGLLAIRGVVEETEPGTFAATPVGEVMSNDHPLRLRAALNLDGGLARSDQAFTQLMHSVRTGESAYPEVFGRTFWEDLNAHPDLSELFDKQQAAAKPPGLFDEVAAAYDWQPGQQVVDVGGGTGDLILAVVKGNPGLRGTLFDRPPTAELARDKFAKAGLNGAINAVGGDFLEGVPAGADVYLLANVLHDWSDQKALEIVQRCAEAGGPGARMLIVERIDAPEDFLTTQLHLRMLVTFGGRQRTLNEFQKLAAAVGRKARLVKRTTSWLSLVEFSAAK